MTQSTDDPPVTDALVIGGGPGGLTCALHLVRLRRSVIVIDGGQSRAKWIPRTHNHPGFPTGIGGQTLLDRLIEQLAEHGFTPTPGAVTGLHRSAGRFRAELPDGSALFARHVVLATGIVDVVPPIPDAQQAMRAGHLRQCPVCDGYEAGGKSVMVIGHGRAALAEALFLRTFTDRVGIATLGRDDGFTPEQRAQCAAFGFEVIEAPLDRVVFTQGQATDLSFGDGSVVTADALYSALGIEPRTELAAGIGLTMTADKRVVVDTHQRGSVEGAYAVGDIVTGLNQLAVAMAQGEIAAIDIHNRLRAADGLIAC